MFGHGFFRFLLQCVVRLAQFVQRRGQSLDIGGENLRSLGLAIRLRTGIIKCCLEFAGVCGLCRKLRGEGLRSFGLAGRLRMGIIECGIEFAGACGFRF